LSSASPPPFRPIGAVLLVFCYFAGYIAVALLGSAFSERSDYGIIHFQVAAHLVAPLVAVYVALWRWAPGEPLQGALGLWAPRGAEWGRVVLAVVAGIALVPVAIALLHWGKTVIAPVEIPPELIAAELLVRQDPTVDRFWHIGGVVVAIPVELLFRGFIQPRLARNMGIWPAVAFTLMLILLVQLNIRIAPAAIVVAAMIGAVRALSIGVWPAMLASVAHEATPVVLHFYGREPIVDTRTIAGGAGIAALALGLAALISRRGERS
jgi:membrane protease YdiL (CAAX protease family)